MMAHTNPDEQTHAHTTACIHIHQSDIVATMSHLLQRGSTEAWKLFTTQTQVLKIVRIGI